MFSADLLQRVLLQLLQIQEPVLLLPEKLLMTDLQVENLEIVFIFFLHSFLPKTLQSVCIVFFNRSKI